MNAVAAQVVPYATAIGAADSDASNTISSWQQKSQQLEQEIVAAYGESVNPTSASSQQVQQCLDNADSLDNSSSASAVDQMESAINQCLQEGLAQQTQYGEELTQASQQIFTQLQRDATKASAAYGSLARLFGMEMRLTSNLPVPPKLAMLKLQVLVALEAVTRDARAGEATTGEPVPALALRMSGDLSALSGQVDSLLAALRA